MTPIARNETQIGATLRRYRKLAGLTQAELATKMHARQGTVSRLESGIPTMQIHTLVEALTALNLELVIQPRSSARDAEVDFQDLF
jgi:HTH-type transcriptional regulator / antitoxin HipB